MTKIALQELGWEVLPHPPYSPDVTPSDYHLFSSLSNALSGVTLENAAALQNWVDEFFASKPPIFFKRGIEKLPGRHADGSGHSIGAKAVNVHGGDTGRRTFEFGNKRRTAHWRRTGAVGQLRTRHPLGRQNIRGEAARLYEWPEHYGARLRPIRSCQPVQPQEEATGVPTNPPQLRMPQGAPPLLQIPAAMRRQFIRRLYQEREHAYGFALQIARWNPALSLTLLSLEMFYSSLLAQALDEGDGGNFGAGECRC
uniref:Histone-lysine N-methyltransferase SETMAR n=1 Tax=Globodera rostochiensis TaxID=31243 RepID=A0A914HU04_GLORO